MLQPDSPVPPLTLRPLSPSAAPALQVLYEASTDYSVWICEEPPHPQQAQHDLTQAAGEDGRFLLGMYLQEDMIGVIDIRLASPEPYDVSIGLILLARAYRRQRLGSWALRMLEAWLARDTPTKTVIVAVPAQNHAAQGYFLANGYVFTGQSTRVLMGTTRHRLLEMRKSLA